MLNLILFTIDSELIPAVYTIGVTIIATAAAIVTIIWFVRDMRRENGKLLKEIVMVNKEIVMLNKEIVMGNKEITKGQREGFITLSEGQQTMAKILVNSQKILERIESNTRN